MKEIYQNNHSISNKVDIFFFVIYLCFLYLGIDFERFFSALGRFGSLIANRYYPVDLEYALDSGYLQSILNSVQMGYLGLVSSSYHSINFRSCNL